MKELSKAELAKMIDHALLRPDLTEAELVSGCQLARRLDVATACVRPCNVTLAADLLAGSTVAVCTVIGFPHGGSTTATKVFEAQNAFQNGATELDMVINIGALRSGNAGVVVDEIRAVVEACPKALVKVILENAYLNSEEKVAACKAAVQAGAHFVKTSTGFAPSGATVEDIRVMRATVGPTMGVKASGGIKTLNDLLRMVEAGATRIGTSSTQAILSEYR